MALLEHFRYLARYVALDDAEIVREFGYLLVDATTEPVDLAPALVQLLQGMPASVEIWNVANAILNSSEPSTAAGDYGSQHIEHLSFCEHHQPSAMPRAVSARFVLRLGALEQCATCSFRLLPDELLRKYAAQFDQPVEMLDDRPIFVDDVRISRRQFVWPRLAPMLVGW